ncbi:MAG: diaminopimelate decarboxylase [Chitinophagales bacterium]
METILKHPNLNTPVTETGVSTQALTFLGQKYGLPLYIYDTNIIKRQYKRLTNAFKNSKVKIKYACKALSNINILRFMHRLGSGLDTVCIQEVKIGLKAGFQASDIIFTPNGVALSEIEEAVSLGVHINIDNISILEQFGQRYGSSTPICIRINPHIFAGGNHQISTGHIDSKFGISIYQMRHVQRIVETTGLKVIGLHMHTGSDIKNTQVFMQAAEVLFDTCRHFKDLQFLDFGSGFKVPYKPDGIATDVVSLGQAFSERFKSFCADYGRDLEVWFEPGKFLVSEAGKFIVKVNVIKPTMATVFAGIDSGLNHLIRPMFYNAYHHIENLSNPNGTKRIYTVSGYICETDNFAWDRQIAEIREGDLLVFHNAGAYGYEMSSNYNSRFRPAEVMLLDGKDYLIRKRDTLEDLLKNQVEIQF